ncbi:plasma membrane calcium, partial [Coemansia sp. RSA 1086]
MVMKFFTGAAKNRDTDSAAPAETNSQPASLPSDDKTASIDIADGDPGALATMVADKDLSALQRLGGTDRLLQLLNVTSEMGIVPTTSSKDTDDTASMAQLSTVESANAELAKELAAVQGTSDAEWLAEFDTDRKLYADRVERYGVNILPPAKSQSFLSLVWDALHDKMLILLIVAAIVSLAIGIYQDVRVTGDPVEDGQDVHWVEGFAIIVAIAVVTLVASINDYQKEKQFRKLNAKKNDRRVRVTRDGQERLISTNCILVGDIMHIEPGDILCADGVVIGSSNLKCDESSVTGESDAMKKSRMEEVEKYQADRKNRRKRRRAELRNRRQEQRAYANRILDNKPDEIEAMDNEYQSGVDADDSTDAENDMPKTVVTAVDDIKDAENGVGFLQQPSLGPTAVAPAEKRTKTSSSKRADPFLISGSRVLEGVGRCVVVAVGKESFYGKILLSLRTKNDPTPLQTKLNGLAELIAKLGGAAGLLMFIVLIIKYAVKLGRDEVSREATKVVDSIVRIIISAVTVVVVAVPEGLPLAVTLALAVATTRMLRDNCLVRVLASCETIGTATTTSVRII